MEPTTLVRVERLTREAYEPFGWVFGTGLVAGSKDVLSTDSLDFWHEHDFNPGPGGVVEFLWVRYKRSTTSRLTLESHRLTEQAIIPTVGGGPIIHVVCPPPPDPLRDEITPTLDQMRLFLLDGT